MRGAILMLAFVIFAAAAEDKVFIGVLGPMSLPEGKAQLNAVLLAVEEINAQGGILGKKVEVVYGDDKLQPEVGAAEFRRLATVEKANVIIGGFSSGVMLATMEAMAETKTIFFADASSPAHPKKVEENYEKYKYWFRISQNNATTFAYDMAEMLKFLKEKYGFSKVYIIRDEHIWADDVLKTLDPLLKSLEIEVLKDVKIPRGYSEYELLLLEAEKMGAHVVVPILALTGTDDILVKKWAELKPKFLIAGHMLAAIDKGFYNRTGKAANYVVFLADGGVVSSSTPTKMCEEFIKKYREKYGSYPEAHQAYGAYDAVYIFKTAAEEAAKAGKDPFNPDVLVKYIERFNRSNPIMLTRAVAFEENHELSWGDSFVRNWVSQWQDGEQFIVLGKLKNSELKLPPWMEEKEKEKTPGFELIAVAIALAIASYVRRS